MLVTGHEGYIGSVLAPYLRESGYDVVGLDTGYFRGCTLGPEPPAVPAIRKDIRDLRPSDLEGFDAVVHLAALSNDPIGNLNNEWTAEINHQATVRLGEMARAVGVRRLLFASSCIMYGMSNAAVCDETAPLDPQTEYARSKARAERNLGQLARDGFSPVFLRNGTVYGLSPRMRLDTVLNSLVASALITGKVIVQSDGKPWRPVVHIRDLVRTMRLFLEAPVDKIHNAAYNNGAECLNYQIIQLAEIVARTVPGAKLEVRAEASADQRTYRADFGKFARSFPDFRFEWTPERGAAELYQSFVAAGFGKADYEGTRFVRLRWLRQLLDTGRLDNHLRWQAEDASR